MRLTPSIRFRGINRSPALEAEIVKRLEKLDAHCDSIMGCTVLVEFAERHHDAGNRFHVRIDLTVPGEEIVIAHAANLHANARKSESERATKGSELDASHKHAAVAVREAFEIARRRVQDYVRKRRRGHATRRNAGGRAPAPPTTDFSV